MASKVDIWNMAYGLIGNTETEIHSESENTPPAIACRMYWRTSLEKVLESWNWSFATRTVELSEIPDPEGLGNWTAAYSVPSDCLFEIEIPNGHEGGAPFEVQEYDGNLRILTDQSDGASLKYIRYTEDTRLFSASFAEVVAANLAMKLSLTKTRGSEKVLAGVRTFHADALAAAITHDGNRGVVKDPELPQHIRDRF